MDCLFLIFEHFNFGDLLNAAQINDEFSSAAADLFRRDYSHFEILFRRRFPLPKNPNELLNVTGMKIDINTINRENENLLHLFNNPPKISKLYDDQIELINGDQILNTFKHFGRKIPLYTNCTFCTLI